MAEKSEVSQMMESFDKKKMPPPKRIQELSQQSTTARRVVAWLHLQLLSVISAKSTWDAASGAPDAAPHNLLEATSVGDRPSAEYHVLGRAMPMLTKLRPPIRQWDDFCIDWWQPAPAPPAVSHGYHSHLEEKR